MSEAPLWRQAFDAVERRVTPAADQLVRTPTFAVGAALVRRTRTVARNSALGATARAWHLLNLPAGSDVSRLRAQIGALDREVRRLTLQLEIERGRSPVPGTDRGAPDGFPADTEERHAIGAEPADRPGPGAEGRRAQRPAES